MEYVLRETQYGMIDGAYLVSTTGQDCCDCPGVLSCPPDTFAASYQIFWASFEYTILDTIGGTSCCSEAIQFVMPTATRQGTNLWATGQFVENVSCGELLLEFSIQCVREDPNNCTSFVPNSPTEHYWQLTIGVIFWQIPSCNIAPSPTSPSVTLKYLSPIADDLDSPSGSYDICTVEDGVGAGRVLVLNPGGVGVS